MHSMTCGPDRRCKDRRRRTIRNGRNRGVLAVLLLDGRDVDRTDLEIGRSGVDGRGVENGRIDLIHLLPELFIRATERMFVADGDIDAALELSTVLTARRCGVG